jgi:hypothetical protein
MRGYGLTVFRGTQPERFEVQVIAVLRHFLPRQDVILIQSDDPRLLHSGIVAGMSGSPIYFEGRLAGALAYGWNFAKDPLAGVTPIESMLAELKRPLRGRRATPSTLAEAEPPERRQALHGQVATLLEERPEEARAAALPWWARLPIAPALPPLGDARAVRASVPLSLSGFGAAATAELTEALRPWQLVPMQAGGASSPERARQPDAQRLEPGGAMAVQLVRGDMSAAATGTVTWTGAERLLGFGHPMFNVGEVYLPVATAEVHTFMSALSTSFKLASPLAEVGSLLQDRQSGVMASTAERAETIPVSVTVSTLGEGARPDQTFVAEVVRHRFLTPMLVGNVVTNAVQSCASDVADATLTVRSNLKVRGFAPLELVDHLFSADGLSARTLAASQGLRAIGELVFNPFGPVNLDGLDLRVEVDYRADVAEIIGVSLSGDALEAGSRPSLTVALRPYAGRETSLSIPIEIPHSLGNQMVKIVAAAGNLVRPEAAPPESVAGLVANLRKTYPSRSVVVSLETLDEGITLRGAVIPDLPGSVIDTLRPGASSRRGDPYRRAARLVTPTRSVLTGQKELTVFVKERRP